MTVTQTRPFDLRLTFAATKKPNPTTKLLTLKTKMNLSMTFFYVKGGWKMEREKLSLFEYSKKRNRREELPKNRDEESII